jgi:hypothetical protein
MPLSQKHLKPISSDRSDWLQSKRKKSFQLSDLTNNVILCSWMFLLTSEREQEWSHARKLCCSWFHNCSVQSRLIPSIFIHQNISFILNHSFEPCNKAISDHFRLLKSIVWCYPGSETRGELSRIKIPQTQIEWFRWSDRNEIWCEMQEWQSFSRLFETYRVSGLWCSISSSEENTARLFISLGSWVDVLSIGFNKASGIILRRGENSSTLPFRYLEDTQLRIPYFGCKSDT